MCDNVGLYILGLTGFRNGSISEDYHSFYHIYEFTDFKWGPVVDETIFQVKITLAFLPMCLTLSSTHVTLFVGIDLLTECI